jgi:hypothetical protein
LGISNGRGIGYGRSLGSSYDSPFTIQESFNGHVRSGANLYGARNPSSGLSPIKPSPAGHHRHSMSVFPIQKALEIAVKESRLLAAASSRGGSGPSGTGMIIGKHWCIPGERTKKSRGRHHVLSLENIMTLDDPLHYFGYHSTLNNSHSTPHFGYQGYL